MKPSIQSPKTRQPISLRTRSKHSALALGVISAISAPLGVQAEEVLTLDKLQIEDRTLDSNPYAEPGAPYKAKKSGDERYKRDLAETPKNISVLTKTQIEDAGVTDLREILDAQPGITLGTGENGNAFGDRYIIRGQEARSDVFVDGLRDPGMSIRESFATEQVEISKGPDSSFGGRGTTGGAVNSVTKQASTDYDFTKLNVGVGTDKYSRVTLDANKVISDKVAVRANLLQGYEEVPDRAPADRDRQGVALSALFKATDKLSILADYYHLKAADKPDLGSFLVGDVATGNRRPAENVPVYLQNQDYLTSDIDTFTTRVKYQFSPNVRISNSTRYGTAENDYVATGARSAVFGVNDPNAGKSTITLSTHQGWQEVEYFANQTNLFIDQEIAGLKHEFNLGLEYTDHKVLNGLNNVGVSGQNCRTGTSTTNNAFCAIDGNGQVVNGLNTLLNRQNSRGRFDQDWAIKTVSISVMDTVDLTEKWTVFGGARHDMYDYTLVLQNAALQQTPYTLDESINNYHAGVTYKFLPNANVYASYSTASDINGGESDVGASSAYGGLAITPDGQYNGRPEKTRSMEVGTKWNLMNNKLLATAALFQIEKSDVFEAAITNPGDPNRYDNLGTLNTGKSETQGIEFGLAGNLTPKLSASAGIALMNAEIKESNVASRLGKTLSNFADQSASVQMKYMATPKLGLGFATKYESERFAGQPDTAPAFNANGQYTQPLPSYTVTDLFATYRINANANVRVNWANIFDKDYYLAGYQSGSFLYKGDASNVKVTLAYDF